MVAAAWEGAAGADVIALLVDASRPAATASADPVIDGLASGSAGRSWCSTRWMLSTSRGCWRWRRRCTKTGVFEPVFMVSALNGDGVNDLAAHLATTLPTGPWLYPEDQLSDMPARLLAAEITREKLFWQLAAGAAVFGRGRDRELDRP